jgi:hypothetical protein
LRISINNSYILSRRKSLGAVIEDQHGFFPL